MSPKIRSLAAMLLLTVAVLLVPLLIAPVRAARPLPGAIDKPSMLTASGLTASGLRSAAQAESPLSPLSPLSRLARLANAPDVLEQTTALEAIQAYRASDGDHATTSDGLAGAQQADPYAAIDACMAAEMQAKGVPGAQVAVMLDGRLTYAKGYGVKNAAQGGDVDADTLFRIGSVTKMMTAAGLMQQVEQGKIDLQQPLSVALPGFGIGGAWDSPGVDGDDLTPWHLLTHSSAYPDSLFITTGGIAGPTTPGSLAAWAVANVTTTLHAPPGTFWNYSNPNFSLAGAAIERLSGMSYNDYMRQKVWGPAAMTQTMLLASDAAAYGNTTFGHYIDAATGMPRIDAVDAYDNWPAAPAGYAFSTTTDLVKWADLLMRGGAPVLSTASVTAMTSRQMELMLGDQAYGYGIFVERDLGLDPILSHGGNIPGWGAYVIWVPERRMAVATLGNTTASMDRTAGCAVVNVLGLSAPTPAASPTPGPTATPQPAPTADVVALGRYAGRYGGLFVDGSVITTTLSVSGTQLAATFADAIAPGVDYVTALPQVGPNIFLLDLNGDAVPDVSLDFLDAAGAPAVGMATPRWLRSRVYVATYQGPVGPAMTATATATASGSTPIPTASDVPPTPTPTYVPPTPTITPQETSAGPTVAPTALPTGRPTVPTAGPILCPQVEPKVPAALLAAAMANPQAVGGYDQPCRRNVPLGPYNTKRRSLTLLNNALPYHPLFNPLTFQCGCR